MIFLCYSAQFEIVKKVNDMRFIVLTWDISTRKVVKYGTVLLVNVLQGF